jgi:hypothetical protein
MIFGECGRLFGVINRRVTQLEQFWRFSAVRMAEILGFAVAWSKA